MAATPSYDHPNRVRVAGIDNANAPIANLTNNVAETPTSVVDDITFNATWSSAQANEIDQNVTNLATKINAILAVLRANGLIDV